LLHFSASVGSACAPVAAVLVCRRFRFQLIPVTRPSQVSKEELACKRSMVEGWGVKGRKKKVIVTKLLIEYKKLLPDLAFPDSFFVLPVACRGTQQEEHSVDPEGSFNSRHKS
jgi:hypothetical protein